MEFQLREMRRRFGLNQTQLSDLLGVTQSTVSRWEKGVEPIRHSKRLELLDLFSNRNGKLDPLIKHLLSKSDDITIFDFNLKCYAGASIVGRATQMGRSDVVGKNYSHLFETEWFSAIYRNIPIEERLYFEYEHVLTVRSQKTSHVPIRTKQHYVQFEDSAGLLLSLVSYAPPLVKPKVLTRMSSEIFDFS
ncbi:MAG: helix-turn-helix domain-containing protein [Rhizobiaceae bacterium]